jgi:hypothetical protein
MLRGRANVCSWHLADVTVVLNNVRFRDKADIILTWRKDAVRRSLASTAHFAAWTSRLITSRFGKPQ